MPHFSHLSREVGFSAASKTSRFSGDVLVPFRQNVPIVVHLYVNTVWSMKKKNIGSTFDSWLREEGLYENVSATAIKRVVARQVEAAMQQKGLTKFEMARRMRTSRSALDRLLDPDNDAITLSTLQKAAAVVGRQVRLELV